MKDRLLELMRLRGWTAITLAARSGVAYGTVRKAMRGGHVAERTWRRLAAGLDMGYAVFVGQVPLEAGLLTADSRALLDAYSRLSEPRRALVRQLTEALA